ncbi:MAG: glycosyltransferase [Acidobacteriota bacterium]
MRPLKLAMIAPLVAPLREPDSYGNHRVIADLARALASRGHDVTVYAAAGSHVHGVRVDTVEVAAVAQRTFALLGTPSSEARVALDDAFARLFEHLRVRGCDVISQHAFDAPAITRAAHWPTVHVLHLPAIVPEVVAALRDARGTIIAVSAAARQEWRRVLGRAVEMIPNGVPGFAPDATPPARYALFAGRIAREKGTAVALRVARALGLRAILAGDIYDTEYFARDVAPLMADATYFGTLPRAHVWHLMTRAAVTLMPIAWDEPFGLVAAEAQLAGCPVAGYRRGALPEVVPDAIGGYLASPDDAAALVVAARRCLELDRKALQRAARERFSFERCVFAHEVFVEGAARCGSR